MKKRIIPKITQTEYIDHDPENKSADLKMKTNREETNQKYENDEELFEKISETKVSLKDFWFQCLDWEMLGLFFGCLVLFLCAVGLASLLYLLFVYDFKESLWYKYFPRNIHEEL
eukprot:GFUD01055906.1.p1 GENE.GFUD01055906.1~~GFUD01055906.1.p1  ORF type:complete len:115 (+),score=23.97 GFUD01055906.1:3-347(+)